MMVPKTCSSTRCTSHLSLLQPSRLYTALHGTPHATVRKKLSHYYSRCLPHGSFVSVSMDSNVWCGSAGRKGRQQSATACYHTH